MPIPSLPAPSPLLCAVLLAPACASVPSAHKEGDGRDPVTALVAAFDDVERAGELADTVRAAVAGLDPDAPIGDRQFAPRALDDTPLPDGTLPPTTGLRVGIHTRVDAEVDDLRRVEGPDDTACTWSPVATVARAFDVGSTCWPERLCRDATATSTVTGTDGHDGVWREEWTTVRLPDDGPEVDLWRAWQQGGGAVILELRAPDAEQSDQTWVTAGLWLAGADDPQTTTAAASALDTAARQRADRLDGRAPCPHDEDVP